MNPIWWMLIGAGAFLVLSVVLALLVDEDGVRDLFAMVVGLLAAPAIAVNVLARRSEVGFRKLDADTLARFSQMYVKGEPEVKAFTFFYGRRGVIFVRKTVDMRKPAARQPGR